MSQNFFASKWVEVDIGAIKSNYELLRQKVSSDVKILGVVKADAYGLGAIEVSRVLEEAGIDMLGVTTIEEGKELREGNIKIPILVFGGFFPHDIKDILFYDLTITIASYEALKWLDEELVGIKQKIKTHIKIETGMGRLGFWPKQALDVVRRIDKNPNLELEGVYSHLATAMWADKSYAYSQYNEFQKTIKELKHHGFPRLISHIANSAATIELPKMHLDMVRVGTVLYGQYPNLSVKKSVTLKDPWSFNARVASVKEIPSGHSVGYGQAYKANGRRKIAVIPVGYVDGLQLEPVAKPAGIKELIKILAKAILRFFGYKTLQPHVFLKNGRGLIAGKVGMQLTMVDVTHIHDVQVGTVVSIPARRTSIGSLIPRIYVENQKVVSKGIKKSAIEYAQSIAAK